MILSFRDKDAERIWNQLPVKRFPVSFQKIILRKLFMIARAHDLRDLRTPPSNRLEELTRDRKGQHSIRINDQWRICFVWEEGNARDVEIVDYH
ncbi:MAG TPA: type II toxin-antitoxin system RelE/ParE family toxin [Thermodesulfobacteriota bacterium]|nr:type II toxin-antitoxin system RelE/ParE family toxin [Thermodesulfobacteriota bacterium]